MDWEIFISLSALEQVRGVIRAFPISTIHLQSRAMEDKIFNAIKVVRSIKNQKVTFQRTFGFIFKYNANGDVSLFKNCNRKLENHGYIFQKCTKKSKSSSFFIGKN